MQRHFEAKRGFLAVTAVLILAMGTLAFSMTSMAAAAAFADSSMKRELRIQARQNLASCFRYLAIYASKDAFLKGEIYVRDLDCNAHIEYEVDGRIIFRAKTILHGVSAEGIYSTSTRSI